MFALQRHFPSNLITFCNSAVMANVTQSYNGNVQLNYSLNLHDMYFTHTHTHTPGGVPSSNAAGHWHLGTCGAESGCQIPPRKWWVVKYHCAMWYSVQRYLQSIYFLSGVPTTLHGSVIRLICSHNTLLCLWQMDAACWVVASQIPFTEDYSYMCTRPGNDIHSILLQIGH